MKNKSINEILDELNFSPNEKVAFNECVNAVKASQLDDTVDAEAVIMSQVEEVVKHEV